MNIFSYQQVQRLLPRGRLVYARSDTMTDPKRKKLAETLERMLESSQSLSSALYIPTPWAAWTWTNTALLVFKGVMDKKFPDRFSRDTISLADGGTVSVDWPIEAENLPDDAPLVIFLHTITGSSQDTSHYTRVATQRGWRSCVFNRRGHGRMSLTTPRFNIMGDAEDTRVMVEHVTSKFPSTSFLGMVGISAGSGLLGTYLGQQEDKTPVEAACCLCPAYDLRTVWVNVKKYPSMDKFLLQSVKKRFLSHTEELLKEAFPESFEACQNAKSIEEFMEAHYPFAGYDSLAEYLEDCNPLQKWIPRIVRPTLLVSADDDMICTKENIKEEMVTALAGSLLIRTQRGSHIAFNEGLFGQGNYLSRISFDFLDAARKQKSKSK